MIKPDEVPEYAGLIYIKQEYQYNCFSIVKKAPQLHKTKYKDAELNLGEKFYYNWQADRRLRREVQRQYESVNKALKEELASRHQSMTYAAIEKQLADVREDREHWVKSATQNMRDNMANRQEIRRLKHEILKLAPDFDFEPIEQEIDKIYGIRPSE